MSETVVKSSAVGTRLLKKDDLDQWADIAHVSNISGPGFSLDTEDVTAHDSPDGWEEVVGTVLRSGELTFDVEFVPDTHADLLTSMAAKEVGEYKLVFPNMTSTCWSFKALVTGFNPSAPLGKLSASVTLKITGKPNLSDTMPASGD